MTIDNSTAVSKTPINQLGAAVVFGATIALAAALMFFTEPFVAKLLLPALGGGPNVWNTCVIFFQVALLLGYLYAHVLSTKVEKVWLQAVIHLVVVWLPVLFLPTRAPQAVPAETHPVLWVFLTLSSMVGAMFFAISTSAPLLQKWYSRAGAMGYSDPYFLYAASNFGGLIGLLAYPFVLEPNLKITEQSQLLMAGYVCFAIMISVCTFVSFSGKRLGAETLTSEADTKSSQAVRNTDYLIWIGIAMLPASLFLGVSTFVTSQLSSIPLFWIIPLAIYLVSFIVAFSRLPAGFLGMMKKLAPLTVLLAVLPLTSQNIPVLLFGKGGYITTGLSLHVIALLFVCVSCHAELAERRPTDTKHLTAFYLCLSVGGLFGSCFNTLIAPYLFKGAEEYPLVLLVAGIFLATLFEKTKRISSAARTILTPIAVLVVSAIVWYVHSSFGHTSDQMWALAGGLPVGETLIELFFQFLMPILLCIILARSNLELRSGLAVVAAFVLLNLSGIDNKTVVYRGRNFFGCLRLEIEKSDSTCVLWNGTCPHGSEYLDPSLRGKPVFYYYPDGPMGRLYDALYPSGETAPKPMAVMGLGAGTAVSLAKPGQIVSFYEINPQVSELAGNPFYFTYLYQAKERKVDVRTVIGDGRMEIQRAPYSFYKLIVSDVYSSSAIPTHMLTKEAIETYVQKLTADGAIAFNLTSGYYDLKPVVTSAAAALNLNVLTAKEYDRSADQQDATYIEWVVLSRNNELISKLKQQGWEDLKAKPNFRLWTDDYCNPLSVLEANFS